MYLNIILHYDSGKTVSFCLIQTTHSFTLEVCVEMVTSHLANFGINVKNDLDCCTTDIVSVMED